MGEPFMLVKTDLKAKRTRRPPFSVVLDDISYDCARTYKDGYYYQPSRSGTARVTVFKITGYVDTYIYKYNDNIRVTDSGSSDYAIRIERSNWAGERVIVFLPNTLYGPAPDPRYLICIPNKYVDAVSAVLCELNNELGLYKPILTI